MSGWRAEARIELPDTWMRWGFSTRAALAEAVQRQMTYSDLTEPAEVWLDSPTEVVLRFAISDRATAAGMQGGMDRCLWIVETAWGSAAGLRPLTRELRVRWIPPAREETT